VRLPLRQVLYNLMEWPLRKGSKLAVIGIANTMDLPERFLPRIARRAVDPSI
jgi:origin recognition complex subunit 1